MKWKCITGIGRCRAITTYEHVRASVDAAMHRVMSNDRPCRHALPCSCACHQKYMRITELHHTNDNEFMFPVFFFRLYEFFSCPFLLFFCFSLRSHFFLSVYILVVASSPGHPDIFFLLCFALLVLVLTCLSERNGKEEAEVARSILFHLIQFKWKTWKENRWNCLQFRLKKNYKCSLIETALNIENEFFWIFINILLSEIMFNLLIIVVIIIT